MQEIVMPDIFKVENAHKYRVGDIINILDRDFIIIKIIDKTHIKVKQKDENKITNMTKIK